MCFTETVKAAMSNPRAACGPVEGFVGTGLGFCCSTSSLHTDNLPLFWQSWTWHFWCRLS